MGAILDMIVSSVAIITTKSGEKINGMTAAWVAQASFEPPLVVVSIAPERYTHQLIDESSVFAVNILSEGQVELGRNFGSKSGRDTDKFKGVNYVTKRQVPQSWLTFMLILIASYIRPIRLATIHFS